MPAAALAAVRPYPGRWHDCLGFADDTAAPPCCDNHKTRPAEASAAGRALTIFFGHSAVGKRADQTAPDAVRRFLVLQAVDFVAKILATLIRTTDIGAYPAVGWTIQEHRPRRLQTFAIALQDGARDRARSDLDVRCKLDACDKADQIERVRHHGSFIKIIEAPDPAPIGVAPGAVI